MAELKISINNRPFQIACADGEEAHVSRLAEELAHRIGHIKKRANDAGDAQLLVLAALMLNDELHETRDRFAAVQKKLAALQEKQHTLEARLKAAETNIAKSLIRASEQVAGLARPPATSAPETSTSTQPAQQTEKS